MVHAHTHLAASTCEVHVVESGTGTRACRFQVRGDVGGARMQFALDTRVATRSELVMAGGSRRLGARSCRARGRRKSSAETSGNTQDPCSSCECSSWPYSTAWWLEATCATNRPMAMVRAAQPRAIRVYLLPAERAIPADYITCPARTFRRRISVTGVGVAIDVRPGLAQPSRRAGSKLMVGPSRRACL